jgi:hypothetical protein
MKPTTVAAGVSPANVAAPVSSILASFAVEIVLTKLAVASWAPVSHYSLPIADSGKPEWGIGVLKIEH